MKRIRLTLLENGLHSLEVGVRFYIERWSRRKQRSIPPDHKLALLLIFQACELLLKERVARIAPEKIWKKQKPNSKPRTIGLDKAVLILQANNVLISDQHKAMLAQVKDWRNSVQHYELDVDQYELENEMGRALKFIMEFMREELNVDPQEVLSPETYSAVYQAVYDYDERMRIAHKEYDAQFEPKEWQIGDWCSTCEDNTVNESGYCFGCKAEVGVNGCAFCGDTTVELYPDERCQAHTRYFRDDEE